MEECTHYDGKECRSIESPNYGQDCEKCKYINTTEKIIKGIIIQADYGYGMKYKDEKNLYLKLEIQQFDGYRCIQLFNQDKVGKLLQQFKSDYREEMSLNMLIHRQIYLLSSDKTNTISNAISKLSPNKQWIYNDNWN